MASYSTLLKDILNEVLVNEIGEANISPLKWNQRTPYYYYFPIEINGNVEKVDVEFQPIVDKMQKDFYFPPKYRDLNNIFNVAFSIKNTQVQFAKTDLKTLLTIISTIIDIVKNFAEDMSIVNGFFIKGTEKEIGSLDISKKTNLYQAFIKKQLEKIPEYGYDTYRDGFIIVKKKLK